MNEVYKHQVPQETIRIGDSDFGYVKNTIIHGAEIENLVKDETANRPQEFEKILTYNIKTEELDVNSHYTVIFDCLELDHTTSFNFKASIGEVSKPSWAEIGIKRTSGRLVGVFIPKNDGTQITEMTTLHFWADGNYPDSQSNFKINNVILLKGDYNNSIPYFYGKQGVGIPEGDKYKIEVKTHGKNLLYKNINAYADATTLTSVGEGATCYIAKVIPGKTYTVSKTKGNRNNVFLSKEEPPKKGKTTGRVIAGVGSGQQVTPKENEFYLSYIVDNATNIIDGNVQIEEGTQATKYEPPHVHNYTYLLPKQLMAGEKLVYDKDYNQYVIKDAQNKTLALTGYYDITFPVYPTPTYVSVFGGGHVDPSIEFDYPYTPDSSGHLGADYFITLTSGDIIDTRQWHDWESNSKEGFITLRDSKYGYPDKIIMMKNITKSVLIHNKTK